MKTNIKILCVILSVSAILSITGCSNGVENESKTDAETEKITEAKTEAAISVDVETEAATETKNNTETEAKTEMKTETKTEIKTEKTTESETEKAVESINYKGMKVSCYGDSLTWYDGQNATWGPYQGQKIKGFESYLKEELGMEVANHGYSGYTIPEICTQLMKSVSKLKNADILIFSGGDNDDRLGTDVGEIQPKGSNFDTKTTTGALQNVIESVYKVNPDIKIILMTEPIGWKYNTSKRSLERVDEKYPNAIRKAAELYELPLIDLWEISGVNEDTRDKMYLDPPSSQNREYMYHPSNYGWEVISGKIVEFFKNLK